MAHLYQIKFKDEVYDGMDEFKRLLNPNILTAEASLKEIYDALKGIENKGIRLSYNLTRHIYVSDDKTHLEGFISKESIEKEVKDIILSSISPQAKSDFNKGVENQWSGDYDSLLNASISVDILVPKTEMTVEFEKGDFKNKRGYGDTPLINLKLKHKEEGIKIAEVKVIPYEKFIELPAYKNAVEKINKIEAGFGWRRHGSKKATNDRVDFLKTLMEEAVSRGKVERGSLDSWDIKYGRGNKVEEIIKSMVVIGSPAAIDNLWDIISSFDKYSLEIRKRFRYQLAQYLIDLDRPLYSLQCDIVEPNIKRRKKNEEKAV
jgi:hypothetical protein